MNIQHHQGSKDIEIAIKSELTPINYMNFLSTLLSNQLFSDGHKC